MIPKTIHQTWKTYQVPDEWKSFVQSWKDNHPDWEYKLWTNHDGFEFVDQHFPELLKIYQDYPFDIQRADVIRYLVVYQYGGLYADLDFECLQSFDSLCQNNQLIIGLEPQKHADDQALDELLCNALFASPPHSPFLKAVIDYLASDKSNAFSHDVLRTTGPIMLQSVYELTSQQGVDVYPAFRFCPFVNNAPELSLLTQRSHESQALKQKLINSGCYAVHHWANSWTSKFVGELHNPTPHAITGYTFFPMLDSLGLDLFFGGRDIESMAKLCLQRPEVVAFNTDGVAKHSICATDNLKPILNAQPNEGLYVKNSYIESISNLNSSLYMPFILLKNIGPKPFRLFLDIEKDKIVSGFIRDFKIWEPVETALVCELISPNDSVIDIGAHIGYFTALFSHLTGHLGNVYAFEPETDNYVFLSINVKTNRLNNVVIENQALSNTNGVENLYLSDSNKGDHRIAPTPDRKVQAIRCITLDQYFKQDIPTIDFIKSDTQGHELEVLEGMTNVIDHNKEHLCCLMEFSPDLLNSDHPDKFDRLVAFFYSYQAEIYWINDQDGKRELVFMDKAALYDLADKMLQHEDSDHSCNILVFFSVNARIKYFKKLGW